MLEAGKVSTRRERGVGSIVFSHPKGNSMPGALLRSISDELDCLAKDADVRVVVLRSEGEKIFCSGASFDEMKAVTNHEQALEFFSGFARVILAIRRCPKFVVARVQGKAAGGGVGLLSACDYVLACESASVRLSELAIGIGPFIIGPAVERKIGKAAFGEMAIGAEWRSAAWAKGHGLITELFADTASLDGALDALAARLASYNPEAMSRLKSVLWEGTENWETLLFDRAAITSGLVLTDFVRNVINNIKS